jgi:hypothetical protein
MPYKARLKQGAARKRKKTEYQVTIAQCLYPEPEKARHDHLCFPAAT